MCWMVLWALLLKYIFFNNIVNKKKKSVFEAYIFSLKWPKLPECMQ